MASLVGTTLFVLALMGVFAWKSEAALQFKNEKSLSMVQPTEGNGEGSLRPEECAPRCDYRCSATSHRKPCLFFCNKCCAKCLCVPPGTYGNKDVCPCYNNWKTKEGKPKCP